SICNICVLSLCLFFLFFFFFQAEDGIRDGHVTGVQTCALPISGVQSGSPSFLNAPQTMSRFLRYSSRICLTCASSDSAATAASRSEERRVGKECRSRWLPDHLKKKKMK